MSQYRVLEKNPITNEWIDRGWVEARGQHAAIKAHAKQSEGSFAAVPETSWHPVKIERREEVRFSISEDGDGDVQGEIAEEAEA